MHKVTDSKIELGATFFPAKDNWGNEVPFESLFIPYIYKEIEFDGVYMDILNGRKDMVIVDVGANIGITVDHFRKYAKTVYAIEPSPENFAALKQNKEFNNWDNVVLCNYALADKDGAMEFTQNAYNRTMNSLMIGEHTGHDHDGRDQYALKEEVTHMPGAITARGYISDRINVPTKGIDTFFEENNITHVDFMKFDPEGSEDMILRSEGFKKVAPMIDAIECEFHLQTWQELVKLMQGFGYTARRYESSAIIVLFTR